MIDAAPSRSELPTQSAPVSPPPITTTCLSFAVRPLQRGRLAARRRAGLRRDPAVAVVEVVHREVDAVELAAGHRQVARRARAGRQHDRVETTRAARRRRCRRRRRRRSARRRPRRSSCSTRRWTTYFSILKSGTPKRTSPPADSSRSNSVDGVAGAAQLLRGGHARRAGADDGDAAAGLALGRQRLDPALLPGAVDDRVLDLLDRHRVALADLEHAGGLARRRAQPAGELGEVVRRVQLADRVVPAVAVDEVVPVRDEVAQRAAVVAERHAALHAARALRGELLVGPADQELLVVLRALGRVAVRDADALDLQEGPDLAHAVQLDLLGGVRVRPRSAVRAASRRWTRPPRRPRARRARACSRSGRSSRSAAAARPTRRARAGRPASRCARRARRRARAARSRRPRRAPRAGRRISGFTRPGKAPSSSSTNARPPLMPAAKLRPVGPSTTTRPPVMYSQPWSPTPSMTALAPELRTAKRSPARPRANSLPLVAPYRTVLPMMTLSSAR